MFLLEILGVDTSTTRTLFWKFCLYSLDIIVFYLLPFAYIRNKFESRRAKNFILVAFLGGILVMFIVVQVASYMAGEKEEPGYIYSFIFLFISVPTQTKFLVNMGVILTAILQGFASVNLFFFHLFDPFFGIELLDEELDFSITRAPREKRVQNLKSILGMIAKEKRKLQKYRK
jgi:hypothetical protein